MPQPIHTNGYAIRALRKAAGIRQKDLAKLAGVSASHLHRIEVGDRNASDTAVTAMAHALQVDRSVISSKGAGEGAEPKACCVDGCKNPYRAKGFCNTHYTRVRLHGSINGDKKPTLTDRFWAKVKKTETCWEWTAAVSSSGYGEFWAETRLVKAHRFSWEISGRSLEVGLVLDHTCRNRVCVNPSHLRQVTQKQNMEHLSPTSTNAAGLRGIYFHKGIQKWQGRVNHDGVSHSTGYFLTKDEAAEAVVALRNELHTHNDLDRQAA